MGQAGRYFAKDSFRLAKLIIENMMNALEFPAGSWNCDTAYKPLKANPFGEGYFMDVSGNVLCKMAIHFPGDISSVGSFQEFFSLRIHNIIVSTFGPPD